MRVRRGVYVPYSTWNDESVRILLKMRAVALNASADPLFSHRSAAAAWGLPYLTADAPVAETLVAAARGGRSGRGIIRRGVDLDAVQVSIVHGFRVTSIERTLIDLARSQPFASAVMALDFAISDGRGRRKPVTTVDRIRAELGRLEVHRGLARVIRVLDFGDGRSESANESLSRARIFELGFPTPDLQVEITHHTGITDRVDFLWREYEHIGEADGLGKYLDPALRSGRTAERVLIDEKRREDRLRSQYPRLSRWEWSDAYTPPRLRAILLDAGLPLLTRAQLRAR
ncbi:hypothetical protein BH11ACT5_BH11ACT5_27910 [soil metagenome]